MWVSPKRLYLNSAGQVVEYIDEGSGSLLVCEGGSLEEEVARQYGLITDVTPAEDVPKRRGKKADA